MKLISSQVDSLLLSAEFSKMDLQYDEQDQMADHSRLIIKCKTICLLIGISPAQKLHRERSGSVVECLTRDQEAAGSSLTGVTGSWSSAHLDTFILA